MFKITSLSLGTIKEKSVNILQYPYENISSITSITADCGCTQLRNDIPAQRVIAEYKAGEIPQHIRHTESKSISSNKFITVKYFSKDDLVNEKTVILGFNATIII